MSLSKESNVSFSPEGKETFRDRLESLLRGRSVRVASQAWGIPASTINNYLHKGTEPALRVVVAIAEAEGVSLEWLGLGLNKENKSTIYSPATETDSDPLRVVWNMIFDSIERRDAEALIKLIHSNGAKGIITATVSVNEMNQTWLNLPEDEKERLLALHEAKKGSSEECDIDKAGSLPDTKQAG